MATTHAYPAAARVFNAVWAYQWYVIKTVWPQQLAVYYPHPRFGLEPLQVFGSLLVLVGISYLAVRYARRRPYLFVGWFAFLGTLVPVIGLVQVGSQGMADRYSYVPLIGLFIIAAWGLPDLLGGRRRGNVMLWGGGILTLALLAVLSARQVGHWRDSEALFMHALSATRDNSVMMNSLGAIFMNEGDLEKGSSYLRRALQISPTFGLAHGNMGAIMARAGRLDVAEFHHRQAVRYDPTTPVSHYNYAAILAGRQRYGRAMHHLSEAVRIDPDYAQAYVLAGSILLNLRQTDAARQFFHRALEADSANVSARQFLSKME